MGSGITSAPVQQCNAQLSGARQRGGAVGGGVILTYMMATFMQGAPLRRSLCREYTEVRCCLSRSAEGG
jgi:hypothetical protein